MLWNPPLYTKKMYRKYLGKARIKYHATVWQEHVWMEWPYDDKDRDVEFEVYSLHGEYLDCVAHGFGLLGDFNTYGFGSVYVKTVDLIWTEGASGS